MEKNKQIKEENIPSKKSQYPTLYGVIVKDGVITMTQEEYDTYKMLEEKRLKEEKEKRNQKS